jgi:hypothetical protein
VAHRQTRFSPGFWGAIALLTPETGFLQEGLSTKKHPPNFSKTRQTGDLTQWRFDRKRSSPPTFPPVKAYSAFQIDELHPHNQNLVGTFHAISLLWSTDIKTAVSSSKP